jgi:OOP family OmpA-OmpF porin
MKFRTALLVATIMALPLAAKAQPISGLYIGGGGGVNIMHDEDARVNSPVPAVNYKTKLPTRVGPAVNLSMGYGLGNGLRAEIEGLYDYNSFTGSTGHFGIGGQEQKFGAMGNVLYDFVGLVPYVQPYVGVGAGYVWTQERNLRVTGPVGPTNAIGSNSAATTDTQGRFAYQGIVGMAYPIDAIPGLALTADYRFMGLTGSRGYDGLVTTTASGRPSPVHFTLNDDFNHTIMIGLRYAFGVTPPPAAPVAAPVPASPVSRSYLVFFDWDKATLTDRARQIVAEAASNSTKVQYTRLEVNGYTDTSGTPQYNQGLSVRRAQAVAAELVKDGVPRAAITIQGFGETHLLVPTGAGVREPQNRRVEIIIR